MQRSSLLLLGILACGLGLRVGNAARNLDHVDRVFIPDDTYYTLSVARSLAAGTGPSVDGVRATNGFQPLLAMLMVPVFWATNDLDVALRIDLLLLSVLDVLCALLLARLGRRLAGPAAGLAAAVLWALSPVALANALGGLETSLALCCCLALVEQWCRCRERPGVARFLAAGALAGLALLARGDTVFLVASLGGGELLRGERRGALLAALAGAIVVAPWWLYSLARFGTFIPESGAAVRAQVAMHQALYLDLPRQLGWAAGTLVGPPIAEAQALRDALFSLPWAGAALFVVACAALVELSRRALRGAEPGARFALGALAAHALAIAAFYALHLPALWFFRRYLAPVSLLVTLLAAAGFARLLAGSARRRVALAALGVLLLAELGLSALHLVATPAQTPDEGLHGAKGYREVARELVASLPAGTTIGAFQSGALAYYGAARIRVVNLDGVVDREAAAAFRERRLAAYARARGATLIVDWPFNLKAFVDHSAKGTRLRVIGRGRPQGVDRALVTELEAGEAR